MTLVEFLTARLDEDEAAARAAISDGEGAQDWAGMAGATDVHIARHDPARVLREVEAKRAIVASYQWYVDTADRPFASERSGQMSLAERQCRHLAAIHADHPDYDPSWRP